MLHGHLSVAGGNRVQKHFAQAAWFPNWERDEDLVLGWALSQGDKVSNSRQSDRYQRAHIATKNPLQGSSYPIEY